MVAATFAAVGAGAKYIYGQKTDAERLGAARPGVALLAASRSPDLEKAVHYEQSGDQYAQRKDSDKAAELYRKAMDIYREAAEQGNAAAQNSIGVMYGSGRGVGQDYAEALNWYRKAAEQSDASAQGRLGARYYNDQDYAEALKWYRKAAEQGDAAAQNLIGDMYSNGDGVGRDKAAALNWYRKAAEQGYAEAQTNIGVLEGTTVARSNYADGTVQGWAEQIAQQLEQRGCPGQANIVRQIGNNSRSYPEFVLIKSIESVERRGC